MDNCVYLVEIHQNYHDSMHIIPFFTWKIYGNLSFIFLIELLKCVCDILKNLVSLLHTLNSI